MKKFDYKARDKNGRIYKGVMEAKDEAALRAVLQGKGFFVTSVIQRNKLGFNFAQKVGADELVSFTERLSVMIDAGLPIMKCLQTIGKQTENEALQSIVQDLKVELERGSSFSEALAKHPKVFSDLYVDLVRAGEAGGVLSKVLKKISQYLSKEHALRQSLIKAFSYPVIVSAVAALVVTFLVIFIVPVFADTYEKMGVTMPVPTLILIYMSKLVAGYWWLMIGAIVLLTAAWQTNKKTAQGKTLIDKVRLHLPIFGRLNRDVAVARFMNALGILISSGITILEALEVAGKIAGSQLMSNVIAKLREQIKRGSKIGDSLAKEKIFPPIAVEMIAAGEDSGNLPVMLEKTTEFLERDVDIMVQKLVVRLEPLLTFMLALVVGFIALAIYLPMFGVISSMTKG